MARRRGQRKGYLHKKGPSWIGEWREDVRSATGALKRVKFARTIAPAKGPGAVSKREAQRIFYDEILSKLDQASVRPSTLMTLEEFIEKRFVSDVVWACKPSGKKHYEYTLKKVKNQLGQLRLRDICVDDVQDMLRQMIDEGKSVQTAVHIKNTVSAVINHAKAKGLFFGDNPVLGVHLPDMQRRELHALTFDQVRSALAALKSPAKEMVLVAVMTSMNIAEMLGVRWKRVNLTGQFVESDGEMLPPFSAAVRENYYRGDFSSVKTGSRRRIVPLLACVVQALKQIRLRSQFTGPDDVVFASSTGRPLDDHNIAARKLKPEGKKLGMPWLNWHCLRRTHTTLADSVGMPLADRQAMMGHATAGMTMHYTAGDVERRREYMQRIEDRLFEVSSADQVPTKKGQVQ